MKRKLAIFLVLALVALGSVESEASIAWQGDPRPPRPIKPVKPCAVWFWTFLQVY